MSEMDAEDKARTLSHWRLPPIEINCGLTAQDSLEFGAWMDKHPFGYRYSGALERREGQHEFFETWLLAAFLAGREHGRRR